VLKVLLDDEEGLAAGVIDRAGGNSRQALTEVETALAKLPKVEGSGAGQLYMAPPPACRFCSQASQLLRPSLTSPVRSSSAMAPHLPDAIPRRKRPGGREISRLPDKELPHMPGSPTAPSCRNTRVVAFRHVAFRRD
jgi:ClpA/ClpB-like protein